MNGIKVLFVVFFIVFFPVISFSAVCLTVDQSDCAWGQCSEYYTDAFLLIQTDHFINCSSGDCDALVNAAKSDELSKQRYLGGNCQIKEWYRQSGCSIIHTHVLCDSAWVANKSDSEGVESGSTTWSGVEVGGEDEAASIALDDFQSSLPDCPDRSSGGFIHTSSKYGVGYTSFDAGDGTVSVNTTSTRRCGYTRAGGNIVPMDGLTYGGGGSSGGGLTKEETADAVGQGVGGIGGKLDGIGNTLGTSLGVLEQIRDHPVSSGPSVEDMQGAFSNSLNSFSGSGYTGGNGSGRTAYTFDDQGKTFDSVFDSFVSTVQGSSIGSIASGFFSGVPTQGSISAPTLTVSGGVTFGNHIFEMSWFDNLMSYLRPVIILCFAFVSVRLVVIKGGSA